MIKTNNFREALGLTQEETAMLLRIGMSQLAMFEVGQRDLPAQAMLKLVKMHNYVQNKQQEELKHPFLKTEHVKITKILEDELIGNQLKQLALERKINDFKSKYQKSLSALQLVEYLETQVPNQEVYEKEFAEMIRAKAIRGIEKNGLTIQTKLNIKLNALRLHQKALEKELERYKINSAQ